MSDNRRAKGELCGHRWHDDDFGHEHRCGEPKSHDGTHVCGARVAGGKLCGMRHS